MLGQQQAEAPRERRRRETIEEILDAAWDLCREKGLAGLSLRDLAARVGIQAPSLYSYFDSKLAIYDAMFRQGYERLIEETNELGDVDPHDREDVKARGRDVFRIFTRDPVRYQLLFQRTVPDFEPSAESYAAAVEYLEMSRRFLDSAGVTTDEARDLWTALWAGLTSQQLANDPGGDRWYRLVDDAVDMFFDHLPASSPTASGR